MQPVSAYARKSDVLKWFEAEPQQYQRLRPIAKDIFRLHDLIGYESKDMYNDAVKGKFGRWSFVETKKPGPYVFTGQTPSHQLMGGALFPILGAFRWMVEQDRNGHGQMEGRLRERPGPVAWRLGLGAIDPNRDSQSGTRTGPACSWSVPQPLEQSAQQSRASLDPAKSKSDRRGGVGKTSPRPRRAAKSAWRGLALLCGSTGGPDLRARLVQGRRDGFQIVVEQVGVNVQRHRRQRYSDFSIQRVSKFGGRPANGCPAGGPDGDMSVEEYAETAGVPAAMVEEYLGALGGDVED